MKSESVTEYLQSSQVPRHRKHLDSLLSDMNALKIVESQSSISTHEIEILGARRVADELQKAGVPAEAIDEGRLVIFSDAYPLYAQTRVCINKVAKALLKIALLSDN